MSGQKIVLIEDDEILSKVLFSEFSDAGFKVLPAFDGVAGLELVKTSRPDLVLLDLILPKKLGLEVLEELKKSPDTSSIPVIILTVLGEDYDIEESVRLGADEYLSKSNYSVGEIVEKVRSFLAKDNHTKDVRPDD